MIENLIVKILLSLMAVAAFNDIKHNIAGYKKGYGTRYVNYFQEKISQPYTFLGLKLIKRLDARTPYSWITYRRLLLFTIIAECAFLLYCLFVILFK